MDTNDWTPADSHVMPPNSEQKQGKTVNALSGGDHSKSKHDTSGKDNAPPSHYLAPSDLFDMTQGNSPFDQDQLLWGDDFSAFNPQAPADMLLAEKSMPDWYPPQSEMMGQLPTGSNRQQNPPPNIQLQPPIFGAESFTGEMGGSNNENSFMGGVTGPSMEFVESLYMESPADNSSYSSGNGDNSIFLENNGAPASASSGASVNPGNSSRGRIHKREFSETLTMNTPLVNSKHNDDYDSNYVTDMGNIQTPVRGGFPDVHRATPYVDQHGMQGSPSFFMHELQSPVESPALQSPNVAFPSYTQTYLPNQQPTPVRPGMRRMMTSPRMQRGMSSASQMNSPSLGDIAEAPGETSPQTPKKQNGRIEHERLASSLSETTPKSAAASAMASSSAGTSVNGPYIGPASASASAAAAAASMSHTPTRDFGSPSTSSGAVSGGTSVSHSRAKRESRRRVTQEQINLLEKAFEENTRPEVADRERLAQSINLDIREVTSWFHKRRLKDRAQASATEGPLKPGKQKGEKSNRPQSANSRPSLATSAAASAISSPSSSNIKQPRSARNSNNDLASPASRVGQDGARGGDGFIPFPHMGDDNVNRHPYDVGRQGGVSRHMSLGNASHMGQFMGTNPIPDPRGQRARPGMMRSSSYGYHQQLSPYNMPFPPDNDHYGESFGGYNPMAPGMGPPMGAPMGAPMGPPIGHQMGVPMGAHLPNGDMNAAMNSDVMLNGPMGGYPGNQPLNGQGFPLDPERSGGVSPTSKNRSKRRSGHARNNSTISATSMDGQRHFGSVASDYSNSSGASTNGFYPASRQRSTSIQDTPDDVRFNSAYTTGSMPFGPLSRSNSIASVSSMSMFPPDGMESRQGSPESRAPMRWPPYAALSRSQSAASISMPNVSNQPYPGDMKRRRSLYGNAVPTLRSLETESSVSARSSPSAMPPANSVASSAAAAALRSSNRRNSAQPAARSRQSSFRLQLEENGHAAQLVVYNDEDSGQSLEGSQPQQQHPQQQQQQQQRQQPNNNVSQALQRLSSLRQLSPDLSNSKNVSEMPQ